MTNTHTIPFLPLGGLFEEDDSAAAAGVIAAATSGAGFFPLPEERQFQDALAKREGAAKAVAVNSCGTALDLCMHALGVGPGDDVITTPLTFVCTATCASALGARVIFADVDANTLNLTPETVRQKITPNTKAIIPVHFAGLSGDLDGFEALSKETGIPLIYDAAHAVGASYRGRPIGGAGKATCYSFQSNKNMTTLGEGGAVTTDDEDFAETVRRKKTFGFVYGPQTRVLTVGFNYRLTKPQLAVGVTQLSKLDRIINARLQRFQRMNRLLADVDELQLPAGLEPGHACHLYVIRLKGRDEKARGIFRDMLQKQFGVQTTVHYPAVWSWEAFADLPHDRRDCPVAEAACQQVVSLPIFPTTPVEDLDYLRDAIKQSLVALRSAA